MRGEVNLEAVYRLFKEKVKDFHLISVEEEKQIQVKPFQLRILSCNVPDLWFVTLDVEYSVSGLNLYKVLVLSEDVCLAHFDESVPFLKVAGVNTIACLPFWVYLTDDFLREYSIYFTDLSEEIVNSLVKWVENVELPSVEDIMGKYIMDMMELTSWWNLDSVMDVVDACEVG